MQAALEALTTALHGAWENMDMQCSLTEGRILLMEVMQFHYKIYLTVAVVELLRLGQMLNPCLMLTVPSFLTKGILVTGQVGILRYPVNHLEHFSLISIDT